MRLVFLLAVLLSLSGCLDPEPTLDRSPAHAEHDIPEVLYGCPANPSPGPSDPPCFGLAAIGDQSALIVDQALVLPETASRGRAIVLAGTEIASTLYTGFPSAAPPGHDSYRIGLAVSTDLGATWTHRSLAWPDLREAPAHFSNATFLVHAAASDGRLYVVGFHRSVAPGAVIFYPCEPVCHGQWFLTSSTDLGETWSDPRVLADLRGQVAYLAAIPGGMAVGWDDGSSFTHSETRDLGATWTDTDLPDFRSTCTGSLPTATFAIGPNLHFLCMDGDELQYSRLLANGTLQPLSPPWEDGRCPTYTAGVLDENNAFILPVDCDEGQGKIAWGPADGSSWTQRTTWMQALPARSWPGPTVSDGAGTLFLQLDGLAPEALGASTGPAYQSKAMVAYRPVEDAILRVEAIQHAPLDPRCSATSAARFGTGILQGEGWGMSAWQGLHFENGCLDGNAGLVFTNVLRQP